MHSSSMISVEGHTNLKRDLSSNAIVNTNTTDYLKYVSERDKRKELENKVDKIANELENLSGLKSEIDELKNMIIQLVNK